MLNRHRVRGVEAAPIQGDVDVADFPPGMWPPTFPAFGDYYLVTRRCSTMLDNTFIRGWNPVNHIRLNLLGGGKPHPCPMDQAAFWSRPRYEDFMELVLDATGAAVNNPDFLDWRSTVMSRIEHQFDPSMSLAVSLFELRKGMKEFLPQMEDLRQNAGGNFLKLKFGIMPFLEDLKDSLNVWSKFKGRLSFLKENRGKTFVHRRKLELELSDPHALDRMIEFYWIPDPAGWYQPPGPFGPGPEPSFIDHENRTYYYVDSVDMKFWIHGIIQNLIGDMDSLVAQADAFGRVVGIGNSPRILWNILPWSWLFDWFVDTDRILDRFEDDGPFEGKLALNECYLTYKVRTQGRIRAGCPHEISSYDDGEFRTTHYTRLIGVEAENLDSSIIQPLLDGSQSAILLALLIQRSKQIPDWRRIYNKLR
jgi:hypothetical protein